MQVEKKSPLRTQWPKREVMPMGSSEENSEACVLGIASPVFFL